MYSLIQIGIVNAVTAFALGGCVWLLSKRISRPALLHALWLLVLLKLVTPALIAVPVGLQITPLAAENKGIDATSGESTDKTHLAADTEDSSATASNGKSVDTLGPLDQPMTGDSAGVLSFSQLGVALPSREVVVRSLLRGWLLGTTIWFFIQSLRILHFNFRLRQALPAKKEVQLQAQNQARQLGLPRAPRVYTLPGSFSPMLWSVFSRAKMVFPRELLEHMDADARATLITHELAHYYRRDHWVRWLEFAVTGLFWWNPIVWLARQQIELAEEECCDSWVVSQANIEPRCYAGAILDTIDFLANDARSSVPVATSLGDAEFLRQRLAKIMRGVAPRAMTGTTRLVVLILSAVVLPIGPELFRSAVKATEATLTTVPESATVVDPKTPDVPRTAVYDVIDEPMSVVEPAERPKESAEALLTLLDQERMTEVREWASASSSEGNYRVVAQNDRQAFVQDRAGRSIFDLSPYQIQAADFSPDEKWLVVGGSDSQTHLINLETRAETSRYTRHSDTVCSVAFSADGTRIVTASRNGELLVLRAADLEVEVTLPQRYRGVNCVRFSPDGQYLALALGQWLNRAGGSIVLWDLARNTESNGVHSEYSTGFAALAFAAPMEIVAATWDGTVYRFDMSSPGLLGTFRGDKEFATLSGFSPSNDQRLLNSTGSN